MIDKAEAAIVQQAIAQLKAKAGTILPGKENIAEISNSNERAISLVDKTANMSHVRCSTRFLPLLPVGKQNAFCIHKEDLQWLKKRLGWENAVSAEAGKNAGRKRA